MKIAVTGASGLIGRTFAVRYAGEFGIAALTRNKSGMDPSSGCEVLETDYSVESLKECFAGCGAVVHLAYALATKDNEAGGLDSYASSMEMTKNVLDAARALGIENVVFASSRLAYPRYKAEPFVETDEADPVNWYGKSKVLMEGLCERYNAECGMAVKCLRFGQIIGNAPNDKSLFRIFMNNIKQGLPVRLIGNNVRDYLYVKDAALALKCAVGHPEAKGIYNISMGKGTDNRAMADALIAYYHSPSEAVAEEGGPGTTGDRIVLDGSKARRELGFACEFDTFEKIAADIEAGAK